MFPSPFYSTFENQLKLDLSKNFNKTLSDYDSNLTNEFQCMQTWGIFKSSSVSKIIEHKLMIFNHNNRHVLLYQIEKSFDACNVSCVQNLSNTSIIVICGKTEQLKSSTTRHIGIFSLLLSNTCLSHLPKNISDFHSNDLTNLS